MKCRFCNNTLKYEFIDLINSPPSNSFLTEEELNKPEIFYPLKLYICDKCFLVQIAEYKKSDDIFSNKYVYFSSYSLSWLEYAKQYVEMVTEQFGLNNDSLVIEIGSNDGYLLQYFKDIPCFGIDPSTGPAIAANEKKIKTLEEFFCAELAEKLVRQGEKADLIIGNNVLAHVPNIKNFVKGLKILLKENGVITMEFPHLMNLIEQNQFDTIYHEHFSYLSFFIVMKIFSAYSLEIFDVEKLTVHGGSLRIYAKHDIDKTKVVKQSVQNILQEEQQKKLNSLEGYRNFYKKVNEIKYKLLEFLITNKKAGKRIAAYGAAAKGNTLLNYCGIKKDLIEFVVDASPHKQGMFLPGSHIPVVDENMLKRVKPDFIIILPWNIKDEIIKQLQYIQDWGGKFLLPVPDVELL
ncbi:Class I SAM-dependent methyltransferase [Candidatus Magnetomoraceae bacterium gMMP-15]